MTSYEIASLSARNDKQRVIIVRNISDEATPLRLEIASPFS